MAVERIRKRRETHRLGRLRLYRDDLEAIARALAEFGDLEFTVNNEVSGTEPKDFSGIANDLPERLGSVTLKATRDESAIEVDLGQGGVAVLVEPDMAARGVLTSIKDTCAPCRVRSARWVLPLTAPYATGGILVAILIGSPDVLPEADAGSDPLTPAATLVIALSALAMMLAAFLDQRAGASAQETNQSKKDVLLNVPRAERPTFKERLVADGGVAAFWCVVGVALGGVVSYLVNQLPEL